MQTRDEYPAFFARFYDTIYNEVRSDADFEYYFNQIKSANGKVLEIGTGTGRFFTQALKSGADIYGIDISRPMLDVLKKKIPENEHYRIRNGDVRTYSDSEKYELVIAPFRVFMHLTSSESQLKALSNVFDLLQPGGRFIFDLFVPDLGLLKDGIENLKDFEGEYRPGKILRRFTSMKANLVEQLSYVTFKLEWQEEEIQSSIWHTELRFYFRYELEHLLERSKFQKFRIYGDFSEKPLTGDSKEFIIHCFR